MPVTTKLASMRVTATLEASVALGTDLNNAADSIMSRLDQIARMAVPVDALRKMLAEEVASYYVARTAALAADFDRQRAIEAASYADEAGEPT